VGIGPKRRDKGAGAAGGSQTFRSPTAMVIWWIWLLFAAANLVDLAVQGRDHVSLIAAATLLLVTGVAYVTAQRPRLTADDAGVTIKNPLLDHHIGWSGVTEVDLADLLRVHCAPRQPGQRGKVISVWAVHYSRRHRIIAETRMQRAAARGRSRPAPFGLPDGGDRGSWNVPPPPSQAEAEAEKIAGLLSERATAARAETLWAEGTAPIAGAGQEAGHEAGQLAGAEQAGQLAGSGPASRTEAASPAAMDLHATGWLEPLTSTWSWPAIAALLIPALILLVVSLI
jgi:Bacterial PH domain